MLIRALIFLFISLVCSVSCEAITNATKGEGVETIFLESPSLLTEVHRSNTTTGPAYFVYGQGSFQEITTGTTFEAVNVTRASNYPYISTHVFMNSTGDIFVIGPSARTAGSTIISGYFLPLTISSSTEATSFQGTYRRYTFYSLSVDERNPADVLAYFVGWGPSADNSGGIRLVVVRAHVNMYGTTLTRNFTWSEENDVISLDSNIVNFAPYHSTFKPHLFHDIPGNNLYVFDPAYLGIYQVITPNNSQTPMSIPNNGFATFERSLGRASGIAWNIAQKVAYIGFASSGILPGKLVQFNLATFLLGWTFTFPEWYSDPSAIVGDFDHNILYIGFPESPQILKFDTNARAIVGYQRVPVYLNQIYRGFDASHEHIYFFTHEQHSKVFRVPKINFCSSPLPYFGFCENGSVRCNPGFALSSNKRECELPSLSHNDIVVEQGAAIAMGILFALVFIAGLVGWYKWWRARSSSYAPV